MAEPQMTAAYLTGPIWAVRFSNAEFGDAVAQAIDANGHAVYQHVSSSLSWAKRDIAAGLERDYGYTGEVRWEDPDGKNGLPTPCGGCDECDPDDGDGEAVSAPSAPEADDGA